MPIYQYKCSDCGHRMEALQRISDPRLTDCPACKNTSLKKQITAAAFKLKGSGWYETDFKHSGQKKSTPNGSGVSEQNDNGQKKDSAGDQKSATKDQGVTAGNKTAGASSANSTESAAVKTDSGNSLK